MVLCSVCHAKVSAIHHSGRANHRQATKMVMGSRYDVYQWRTKFVWFAPLIILAILIVGIL
jgi:hypothetical protein